MGLYERLKGEVVREAPAPGFPVRRVMLESARLRALAARANYQPQPPRGMPDLLDRRRRAIEEPAEQAREAARRPAARREELTGLLAGVEAELTAMTYRASPEQAESLLRRREALQFLLDKVPPPVEVPDALALAASVSKAVTAEIEELRNWITLLEAERTRVKVEIEEAEQRGSDWVREREFKRDLADVRQALDEARVNLKLAENPPLRQPLEPPRPAVAERPPVGPDMLSKWSRPRPLGKF